MVLVAKAEFEIHGGEKKKVGVHCWESNKLCSKLLQSTEAG